MAMEPGHFLVFMKSEKATNNSLVIGTRVPLGETAKYPLLPGSAGKPSRSGEVVDLAKMPLL